LLLILILSVKGHSERSEEPLRSSNIVSRAKAISAANSREVDLPLFLLFNLETLKL
jgi:hypothetical protein